MMGQDDYRELIQLVTALMGEMRCGDLTDPRHYVVSRDGERFILPPRKQLYEMLRAFDRRLALFDRTVFNTANERIAAAVIDEWPGRVVINLPGEEARALSRFDLTELPDLSATRAQLQALIDDIARDGGDPEEPEFYS